MWGVDEKIILKLILGKWVGSCGLDASGSVEGAVAGPCEHGYEPSGFIKGGELLD
jgi:hypothetical protein